MERTDYLDLYKLANGDYANRWEIPMNANAQAIDDELANLKDELLNSAIPMTDPHYSGQLARTAGSLEQRLDAAMDPNGNIIYNNGDLDKSCHQMDGFETTEISARLANIDRREFVNARLRYLLENTASATTGEFIKKRDVYTGPTGVELNRYTSELGVRLDTCLFDIGAEVQDPTQLAGVLSVNKLGWCSIAGQLYYHSNTSYYTMAALPETIYSIFLTQEPIGAGPQCIDSRLIRSYASTGCGNGTTSGSTFTAAGIGAASSTTENNNWQPEAFQILRIEPAAGVYHEYLIKTINAGNVEIYGEFPYDTVPPPPAVHWWVLDYTIPCVNIVAYVPSAANRQALLTSGHTFSLLYLMAYQVSYDSVAPSFQATKIGTGYEKGVASNPLYQFIDCSSLVFALNKSSLALAPGAFNTRIKSMKILCMEFSNDVSGGPIAEVMHFLFSVDPCTLLDIDGTKYCIPSINAYIDRALKTMPLVGAAKDLWSSYSNAGQTTYLRFLCSGAADGSDAWITNGASANRWWGVLIEYA